MHPFESLPNGAAVGRSAPEDSRLRKNPVSAGFGSPGADATVRRVNLNDALITHPQATFIMRATGSAMAAAGVGDGDVLLVDRALTPAHGCIVIAVVDGELVCRRLWQRSGQSRLQAAGPDQAEITFAPGSPVEIWGVVTTAIRSLLV
jgi:DNA polymerase V